MLKKHLVDKLIEYLNANLLQRQIFSNFGNQNQNTNNL